MNVTLLGSKKLPAKAIAKRRVGRREEMRFRSGTRLDKTKKYSVSGRAFAAKEKGVEKVETITVAVDTFSYKTGSNKGKVVVIGPRLRGAMNIVTATMKGFSSSSSRRELLEAARNAGYSGAEVQDALKIMGEARSLKEVLIRPSRKVRRKIQFGEKTAMFNPHAAGRRLVEELQAAEGGAWTGNQLHAFFDLTPSTLHRRRKEHRIIYWRDALHEFHYPMWQFTPAGALLPGIQEVLELFKSQDEWRVMRYFLDPRTQLSDQRPLDLLRQGNSQKILEHAKIHVEENTW